MLPPSQTIRPFIRRLIRLHELNPHTSLKRLDTLFCARSSGINGLEIDEASRFWLYQAPCLTSKNRICVCFVCKLSIVSKAPEIMKPLFPKDNMRRVE